MREVNVRIVMTKSKVIKTKKVKSEKQYLKGEEKATETEKGTVTKNTLHIFESC